MGKLNWKENWSGIVKSVKSFKKRRTRTLKWELGSYLQHSFYCVFSSSFQNYYIYQESWRSFYGVKRGLAKQKIKRFFTGPPRALNMLMCTSESVICSIFQIFYLQNYFCRKITNVVLICIYLIESDFLLEYFLIVAILWIWLTTFFFQLFSVGSSVCFGKTSDFNSFSTHCWLWPCKSREPEAGFQYWKLQCAGRKVQSI